jgi:acetate kinase
LKVLVFNCGSSSLTFKVFEKDIDNNIKIVFSGKAHRLLPTFDELPYIEYHYNEFSQNENFTVRSHAFAAELVINKLKELGIEYNYIGHRWLHSSGQFNTVFIDDPLRIVLYSLIPLFPIHHPAILSVINKCRNLIPDIPQYITVDNAFHSTIPFEAFTYTLPKELINKFGFRKFGFHGLSYQYVTKKIRDYFKLPQERLKIIACHLGTGGSSVAAIKDGKSIDTSMGYTSLTGLVMSTRTGDIDPMLSVYLMGVYGYRPDDLMNLFNKKSGLLGVSEFSSDIRDIIKRISEDSHSRLAFNMYIHRLKKYIGSYAVVLGGIDILIFTDDIGVHNWLVREKVCENMDWCGIKIDYEKNSEAITDNISQINSEDSKVKILSIPTEEEYEIFYEGLKLIEGSPR